MTIFKFVRHGETSCIKENCFSGGKTDSPLTEKGIIDTKLFVRELANKKEHFDLCLTSRMQRTKTFGLFFKEFFEGPVFADFRFNEKDAGIFEGCKREDFKSQGWENKYINRWSQALPCGESHYEVALRTVEALKFWEEQYPNHRILVGSHTDVIRAIEALYHPTLVDESNKYVFRRDWKPIQPTSSHPSDEQLTKPIPYFYTVEIDSNRFILKGAK